MLASTSYSEGNDDSEKLCETQIWDISDEITRNKYFVILFSNQLIWCFSLFLLFKESIK